MRPKKTPGYRCQKRAGRPALAFTEISGVRRYLGEHGTAESRRRYAALIAEWQTSGGLPPANRDDLRVIELVDRYWAFAQLHYRKHDGTPTSEAALVKRALGMVVGLYSELPAKEFSPLKFKAVRDQMIRKGWCRKVVNDMMHRVKRMFRWGTEDELVPATTYHALQAVAGLKSGRSDARESEPVLPVPDHLIDGALPHLSPQVAAIVRLQLLTGARPGEICLMRACDIDTSAGKVWTYRPGSHKTQHHGYQRTIYLGPKAQRVIEPFLKPDLGAFLFSAAEAEAWHREQKHKARKTPLSCGNKPGSVHTPKPERRPGDHFTVASYRKAITRGCDAAFPPSPELARQRVPVPNRKMATRWETTREWQARLGAEKWAELRGWRKAHRWHPHRLRHNAATRLRHEYGIDLAQTILGHRLGSAVTEIYAAANVEKAKGVMQLIG